jgi:hypothetical protein
MLRFLVPTVLNIGGYRVVVYPNDHRPAHVHVMGAGQEALFFLNCTEGPVSLRENYGFRSRELAVIKKILNEHLARLCTAWKEIHDSY